MSRFDEFIKGGGSLPLRAHFVGRYPLCGLKRRPQRLLAENRHAVLPTSKTFLKYRGSDGRGPPQAGCGTEWSNGGESRNPGRRRCTEINFVFRSQANPSDKPAVSRNRKLNSLRSFRSNAGFSRLCLPRNPKLISCCIA